MKKTFAIVIMILSMAMSVMAQSQDEAYTAEINKMLNALNAKDNMVKTVAASWQQMQLPISNYTSASQETINDIWTDLVQDFSNEYKKHFTLEEMREINAFYATPIGKKLGLHTTEISNNIMVLVASKYATRIQNVVMKYISK